MQGAYKEDYRHEAPLRHFFQLHFLFRQQIDSVHDFL